MALTEMAVDQVRFSASVQMAASVVLGVIEVSLGFKNTQRPCVGITVFDLIQQPTQVGDTDRDVTVVVGCGYALS